MITHNNSRPKVSTTTLTTLRVTIKATRTVSYKYTFRTMITMMTNHYNTSVTPANHHQYSSTQIIYTYLSILLTRAISSITQTISSITQTISSITLNILSTIIIAHSTKTSKNYSLINKLKPTSIYHNIHIQNYSIKNININTITNTKKSPTKFTPKQTTIILKTLIIIKPYKASIIITHNITFIILIETYQTTRDKSNHLLKPSPITTIIKSTPTLTTSQTQQTSTLSRAASQSDKHLY